MVTLDRAIDWYKVTISPDLYGQQEEVWAKNKSVWAKVMPLRGYEYKEANQHVAVGNIRFIVRYDVGWEELDRIIYNGITYDIVSIQEFQPSNSDMVNTRMQFLLLDCQDRDSENTGHDG